MASLVSTRAVTVAAPPAAIWPWLVQMGPGRGGAYTYDWIENLLGLDMHSADAVLPEFLSGVLAGQAELLEDLRADELATPRAAS